MKNRTDFIGIGVKDQTRQALRTYQHLLQTLVWGLASFLLAVGNMLSEISPFGVAVCAACPKGRLIPVTLGVVAGSLLSGPLTQGGGMSVKYMAAAVIVAAVRWSMDSGSLFRSLPQLCPLLAGAAMLLPSATAALASRWVPYYLVMAFAESVMAGACAYFMQRTIRGFQLGQGVMTLKRSDTACMTITLCVFLVSLGSIPLGQLSLGRLAAALLVMLCALMGGEGMGAVAGVACGASVSLALFPQTSLLGVFALAGLVAGVFAPMGRLGCAGAFVIASGGLGLISGYGYRVVPMMVETLIASTVLLLLPQRVLSLLRSQVFRHVDRSGDKGVKDLLLSRMTDASAALGDIANTTQKVSKQLERMKAVSIGEVYSQAIDGVCQACGLKARCWQQEYSDSMNVFNSFTFLLRKNGRITAEDFTYPLSSRCKKKDELAQHVNSGYRDFLSREGMSRKVARVRSVVTDQFQGMGQLLQDFARELCQVTCFDNHTTLKLCDYLDKEGIQVGGLNCYRDQQERLFVQLYLPRHKLARLNCRRLTREFSQICDCCFDQPEEICLPGGEGAPVDTVRLTFREKAVYTMEYAASQHICQGASLCGDSYSTFTGRRAVSHMLLSDGMGSGTAAAVDSRMTVSLISKLVDAGVGYEASLKMVNSALLVKSGEESLSTVDMTAVDLYSGRADFYKAGAAPTFVKRGGKTGSVESTSLPVGILTAVDFQRSSLQLQPGDLVVMVSDGAVSAGTDWVRLTIDHYQDGDSLQQLCDDIATTAKLKRNDSHDDDITVVAGVLRESDCCRE